MIREFDYKWLKYVGFYKLHRLFTIFYSLQYFYQIYDLLYTIWLSHTLSIDEDYYDVKVYK